VSSATKVVQFASLGLGARVARRFEVLNPTSEAYEFFWEKTSNGSFGVESERDHSPFRCLTPRGVVAPGKRYEMAFEYAPAEGDAHERAFTFRAPSVGVSVPFLLAGAVTEPRVTLDTACVNFGKCLVGATRRESVTLVNHESVPFKFSFENLVSATYGVNSREVTFDPPSGTIGPLGEVRIAVAYKPTHEGSRSVNVAVNVDRKVTPIRLNVKAETYAIREACALEQDADYGQSVAQGALPSAAPSGRPNIALAPAPARNAVSLGRVCVDDVATRRVSIANEGELTFEAEWSLGLNSRLSVSPEYFSVAPGERRVCEIAYRPNRTETLRESDAVLTVVNGRSYAFVIEADARKPLLVFSSRDVVFGPALIEANSSNHQNAPKNARVLTLTNQDSSPLAVDCAFDSVGDDDAGAFVLVSGPEASVGGGVLKPGASCEFVFAFEPREPRRYETYVPFEVNGVKSTRVRVSGEGVKPRLELQQSEKFSKNGSSGSGSVTLDFGSARAKSAIVKTLTLVNKCPLPVEVAVESETLRAISDADVRCAVAVDGGSAKRLVAPPPETPEKADDAIGDSGDSKQTNENTVVSSSFSSVVVPARKTVTYKLTFAPEKRSRPFQVPFAISVAGGAPKAVSLLVGGCVGAELALSRDALDFGAVVDGARVTKTVLLQNTGDVGCSFAFDVASALVGDKAHLRRRFELFPQSGYVGPGADQEIRLTFVAGFPPGHAGEDAAAKENGAVSVNYDFVARCVLDDGADTPLELSVLAKCVTASAPTDTVRFSARARGETVVETVVRNSTNEAWRLAPTIANGNWRGAETLFVPARGEASYAITYAPLSVSSDEDPHCGSVRFELPDGTVDTRTLSGVADLPETAGVVEASVPAKKAATISVPVKNFVESRRQRFRATVTFSEDDSSPSSEAVTLRGPEFIEVAANATRSYPLSFYGFKEGTTTRASVTFADVDTNEVATYDVAVTTSAPETQGEISLRAAARQKVTARVPVTNPLSVPVDVTTRFSNPRTFAVDGETTTIPAKTTKDVRVGYRPVVAETAFSDVVVESDVLGAWPFRLALSATAAGPERGVSFTVPLGSAETKKVTFAHFLDEPAAYDVRFRGGGGNGAFVSAATHQAQAASGSEKDEGSEQSLDVTFEPMSLGSQFRDVLLITSETGGEYVVPVSGRCVAPKPVGPIVVGATGASVSFKNPFDAETTFVVTTDNPAFVAARSETIGAKQTKTIGVRYEPSDASRGTTAKLLVTSDRVPGAPWAFYLKAE
jgi:hydrocephalus-inducing protein